MSLPPINIVMDEVSDPEEVTRALTQFAQAELNSEWLQAHAAEIYGQHRGKFIVVAGEELFVADTPEDATAFAKAAHPDDEGRIIRYIYPKKMARVYANQW